MFNLESAAFGKSPMGNDVLNSACVEVWTVGLDSSEAASRTFRSILSDQELTRADRFVSAALTSSYLTSHGVLRVLLSKYLKCHPGDIGFDSGWAGKPVLKGESLVHFNMSHSGNLAAYAFTSSGPLGIDIERIRHVADLEEIAERHFCLAETTELLSIPGELHRREAFFRCWTRKESYIKALGDGLSAPLDRFQVTLLADAPARLVHVASNDAGGSTWAVHHLEPVPGYVGALTCSATVEKLQVHPFLSAQDVLESLLV